MDLFSINIQTRFAGFLIYYCMARLRKIAHLLINSPAFTSLAWSYCFCMCTHFPHRPWPFPLLAARSLTHSIGTVEGIVDAKTLTRAPLWPYATSLLVPEESVLLLSSLQLRQSLLSSSSSFFLWPPEASLWYSGLHWTTNSLYCSWRTLLHKPIYTTHGDTGSSTINR